MESVTKIKEELSARSRTATLDQLASEGRKRVRLVRAEHIAQMISEAVHSAVEQSGLLDQQEVDRLVEQSRSEFKGVLAERQQEQAAHSELTARCAEQETQLEANEEQLTALRAQCPRVLLPIRHARARVHRRAYPALARGRLGGRGYRLHVQYRTVYFCTSRQIRDSCKVILPRYH